jgi:hypothetical protein
MQRYAVRVVNIVLVCKTSVVWIGTKASQPRKRYGVERAEEEGRDSAASQSELNSHRTSEEPQYL